MTMTGTDCHAADKKQAQEEPLCKDPEVFFNFHARTFSSFSVSGSLCVGTCFSTVRGFISTLSGTVGDTFVF